MPSCMRYKNEQIREHLASHYVVGVLSQRVAKRCERLMKEDPDFEASVYRWQQQLSGLNTELSPVPVPDKVWSAIDRKLNAQAEPGSGFSLSAWWSSLLLLRMTVVLLFGALLFFQIVPDRPQAQASYMALLSSSQEQNEPSLILSAYKGEKPGGVLRVQWNDRQSAGELEDVGVLAIDRASGELTLVARIGEAGTPILLDKPAWVAIKNSAELVIVKGSSMADPVLFRGPCVELGQSI